MPQKQAKGDPASPAKRRPRVRDRPRSFRFSAEELSWLKQLSQIAGLSETDVLRELLKYAAEKNGLRVRKLVL